MCYALGKQSKTMTNNDIPARKRFRKINQELDQLIENLSLMIKIINTHFVLFFDAKTLLKHTDGFDLTSNYQADT